MTSNSLNGIKAAIFDMDGTMINNYQYHQDSWIEFCHRYNIELTKEDYRQKISGRKNDQILRNIFGNQITLEEIQKLTDEKEAVYRELYANNIKEIPGLTAIINELESRGIKLAIATTAPKENRKFCLDALGLQDRFPIIFGEEDVTYGKPNPEIYLKTAQKLGIKPSECIVFEDSGAGVTAGKDAGMKVVAILSSRTPAELDNADCFAKDFTEISFE